MLTAFSTLDAEDAQKKNVDTNSDSCRDVETTTGHCILNIHDLLIVN